MVSLKDYIKTVEDAVSEEKPFSIRFYILDLEAKQKIEAALKLLFTKFNRDDLYGVMYSCLKELLINASKANLKRILFEDNHLNIDNDETYVLSMIKFKEMMTEEHTQVYLHDLKERYFWIFIHFHYNQNGIRLEVVNNAQITSLENRRLREKLKRAMQYDDIVQYYIEQGDELEGAGMGIALVVMLLKGLSIPTTLFRIGNTAENQTVARIEIPLTSEFVSIRKQEKQA